MSPYDYYFKKLFSIDQYYLDEFESMIEHSGCHTSLPERMLTEFSLQKKRIGSSILVFNDIVLLQCYLALTCFGFFILELQVTFRLTVSGSFERSCSVLYISVLD